MQNMLAVLGAAHLVGADIVKRYDGDGDAFCPGRARCTSCASTSGRRFHADR
ncbi:hypothetical protein VXQ18_17015 [Brucella abortus]|nr:hypothetical protein [Brucella abortus]